MTEPTRPNVSTASCFVFELSSKITLNMFQPLLKCEKKPKKTGLTGIQTPSSYRSAICGSGFYLTHWGYVSSAQGLGCEVQVLWLQTKPRTDSSLLTDLWWRLACLIRLRGVSSIQRPSRAKRGFFSFSAPIAVASLRNPEALIWWDQAMFGHECGFWGRTDVDEGEWKLTE